MRSAGSKMCCIFELSVLRVWHCSSAAYHNYDFYVLRTFEIVNKHLQFELVLV